MWCAQKLPKGRHLSVVGGRGNTLDEDVSELLPLLLLQKICNAEKQAGAKNLVLGRNEAAFPPQRKHT